MRFFSPTKECFFNTNFSKLNQLYQSVREDSRFVALPIPMNHKAIPIRRLVRKSRRNPQLFKRKTHQILVQKQYRMPTKRVGGEWLGPWPDSSPYSRGSEVLSLPNPSPYDPESSRPIPIRRPKSQSVAFAPIKSLFFNTLLLGESILGTL